MKKQYKKLIFVETAIVLSIAIIYIIVNFGIIKFVPKCIFFEKFGYNCPSCGGTRFISNLIQFKISDAFFVHPIFFIITIYLGVLNLIYIINVIFSKNIKLFKCWHVIFFTVVLLIYTFIKNIF